MGPLTCVMAWVVRSASQSTVPVVGTVIIQVVVSAGTTFKRAS